MILAFDFDGVLINSLPCMELSWRNTCADLGIEIPFARFKDHIGLPFMQILANLSIFESKHDFYSLYFKYSTQYSSLVQLYPGVYDALKSLKSYTNCHVAIVTSKPRDRSLDLISKFQLPVDILLCPEDTPRGKPHPDPLNHLTNLWPTPSTSLYFFGDMATDYLCSCNALWNFIYCEWGYGRLDIDLDYPYQTLYNPLELSHFLNTSILR